MYHIIKIVYCKVGCSVCYFKVLSIVYFYMLDDIIRYCGLCYML